MPQPQPQYDLELELLDIPANELTDGDALEYFGECGPHVMNLFIMHRYDGSDTQKSFFETLKVLAGRSITINE